MTWTKTSDTYPDRHLDLSDAAYRLHHAATTYCNRVGLDGVIPRARLTLIPVPARTRRASVIRELQDAGLWALDASGWTLTDFFEDQPSADEARLTRDYNRVRERIRLLGKSSERAEKRADLEREKATVLERLNEARERRRSGLGSAIGSATGKAPSRSASLRSAPKREREQDAGPDGFSATAPPPRCPDCGQPITEGAALGERDGLMVTLHRSCKEIAA